MKQVSKADCAQDAEGDWDLESAEARPGAKRTSVVVSVRLPRRDFDRISKTAEAAGIPVSTFLRNAALKGIVSQ